MEQEEIKERESYLSDEEVITFCKVYLQTWSKTEAYLSVHPDSTKESAISNAPRYFNNPKIREFLALILEDKVMSLDEVFIRLGERARDSSNKQAQLKALELLGRTKGLFVDRTDLTTQGKAISWTQFIENTETTEKSE